MKEYKIALSDESPFIMRSARDYLACLKAKTNVIVFPAEGNLLIQHLNATPVDMLITEFSSSYRDASLDGIEKIKKITQDFPQLRLVILTAQRNIAIIQGILKYPLAGLVSKYDEGEELTNALTYLLADGRQPWLSSGIRRLLAEAKQKNVKNRLTLSEMEVIRRIAQGHSLSDIARLRKRSISTISTQKYNAMRKLFLHSTSDLIKYAFSEKLI